MSNIIDFLVSREVILVYVLAALAITVALLFYLKDKSNIRKQLKQNTKELNQLVEQIAEKEAQLEEQTPIVQAQPVSTTPVAIEEKAVEEMPVQLPVDPVVIEAVPLQPVIPVPITVEEQPVVTEAPIINTVPVEAEAIPAIVNIPEPTLAPVSEVVPIVTNLEEVKPEILIENNNVVTEIITEENKQVEEIIEYTDAQPDQTTAQAELASLALELQEKEAAKNIELTEFELKQEENAIISLDELMNKGNAIYESNEITQYADEGNEPISIQDLEERMQKIKSDVIMLEAPKQEELEVINTPIVQHIETLITPDAKPKVILDDLYTIEEKDIPKEKTGFQSSPIISPIYGITKASPHDTNLELENTANFDKLDEEIRKTNEFLMTLRELQKNLE